MSLRGRPARRRLPGALPALLGLALLAAGSPGRGQSSSSYFEAVDSDHDGRISLPEFQERMSWAFRQMDRDGDQVLRPDEQLVPNAPTLTLAEHHRRLAAQYRRQDKNQDGWLSPKEFLAPPA